MKNDTDLISPVLLECMELVVNLGAKITAFCESDISYKDSIHTEYAKIDGYLSDVAAEIGNIIREDVLSKTYYSSR